MSCNFCNVPIYIKTIQYAAPVLTAATEVEALRQKIQDKTGEIFLIIPNKYCPMCGDKLKGGEQCSSE